MEARRERKRGMRMGATQLRGGVGVQLIVT